MGCLGVLVVDLVCHGADSRVDVFVVDLVGELPLLYAISEIAFVGNSLLEGDSLGTTPIYVLTIQMQTKLAPIPELKCCALLWTCLFAPKFRQCSFSDSQPCQPVAV